MSLRNDTLGMNKSCYHHQYYLGSLARLQRKYANVRRVTTRTFSAGNDTKYSTSLGLFQLQLLVCRIFFKIGQFSLLTCGRLNTQIVVIFFLKKRAKDKEIFA